MSPKLPFKRLSLLIITIAWLLAASCSPAPSAKQTEDQYVTKSEAAEIMKPDSVGHKDLEKGSETRQSERPTFDVSADTIWDDSLKKYFSLEQIATLKQAHAEYQHISDAADLAVFYRFSIEEIRQILDAQIRERTPTEPGSNLPKPLWAWFTKYFPFIKTDVLCLDCAFGSLIDARPLLVISKKTAEPEDDLFFGFATALHDGPFQRLESIQYSSGLYALVSCDICEASTLGNGKRYEILLKLEKAIPARPLFGSEMNEVMISITQIRSGNYLYSKQKVMEEVGEMLTSSLLTKEQKRKLTDDMNLLVRDAQFDCGDPGHDCW